MIWPVVGALAGGIWGAIKKGAKSVGPSVAAGVKGGIEAGVESRLSRSIGGGPYPYSTGVGSTYRAAETAQSMQRVAATDYRDNMDRIAGEQNSRFQKQLEHDIMMSDKQFWNQMLLEQNRHKNELDMLHQSMSYQPDPPGSMGDIITEGNVPGHSYGLRPPGS